MLVRKEACLFGFSPDTSYIYIRNTLLSQHYTGGVKQARSRSRSSNCSIHTKNSNEKEPGTHDTTISNFTLANTAHLLFLMSDPQPLSHGPAFRAQLIADINVLYCRRACGKPHLPEHGEHTAKRRT